MLLDIYSGYFFYWYFLKISTADKIVLLREFSNWLKIIKFFVYKYSYSNVHQKRKYFQVRFLLMLAPTLYDFSNVWISIRSEEGFKSLTIIGSIKDKNKCIFQHLHTITCILDRITCIKVTSKLLFSNWQRQVQLTKYEQYHEKSMFKLFRTFFRFSLS